MRKIALIAICSILGISCETESVAIKNAPQGNLPDDPSLVSKLLRVSQYPTTVGNIVDSTSCFAIVLPATVVANGQSVVLASDSDYQQIRTIFASSENDSDTVEIGFPIQITYSDYTSATMNSISELENAVSNCLPSVELSCLSFDYPIEIKSYDTDNQLAETITLGNKTTLFQYLNQLMSTDVATLVYPLTLNSPDGNPLAIENNDQLEAAIDIFTNTCLAALSPDTNPIPDLNFDDNIVNGSWHVSYFYDDDDDDETSAFSAYTFTFSSDGSVLITGGTPGNFGDWDTYSDSGTLVLELDFSDVSLEALEEDWTVTEYTSTLIKMSHESGGGGGTDHLTLQKN